MRPFVEPPARSPSRNFLHEHSLSLATALMLICWVVLYRGADPDTHLGAFYGNAIADWIGTLLIIMATKWLFEKGSMESRPVPMHLRGRLRAFFVSHSLTIFVIITGLGWVSLYSTVNPMDKWGQVVGNIVSEWGQVLGTILFTKVLIERGSKESRS